MLSLIYCLSIMLLGVFTCPVHSEHTVINKYHIVMNEIMYAPSTAEPEWIELYNAGFSAINMAGWTIEDADSARPRLLTDSPLLLEPDGYLCIVQNLPAFALLFSDAACTTLEPSNGWPRLNNKGDHIVLRDGSGVIVDELTYEDTWGGSGGVSLERMYPDHPANSPDSWSSSVSDFKATPCRKNSVFYSAAPGKARLWAEPDPFDEETTISYQLTVPTAIVKLEVYDMRGRMMRTLIDQTHCGSTGSVVWRGENREGKTMRMGIYILYLEAIHAERGVLDRVKSTVTFLKPMK